MKGVALWVVLLLSCVGIAVTYRFSVPLLYHLLLGWIFFCFNTLPRVSLRPDGLLTFGLGLLMLVFTVHLFLRWLVRNMAAEGESRPRVWRLRWTICGTALVLLMFVAGIALVGITHQAAWLARTPEGVIVPRLEGELGGILANKNKMKQMMIGMWNFQDIHQTYPRESQAARDEQGRPAQSWITQVMPFMWHRMSEDYDANQAWDAPQNRADFQCVHPVFLNPELPTAKGHNEAGYGVSHYAANEQVFGAGQGTAPVDAANTLMIGELNADFSPWGEPGANIRPPVMRSSAERGFGGPPTRDTVLFAMADGQVRKIDKDIDPEVLRALGAVQKQSH